MVNFDEKTGTFRLETPESVYCIKIADGYVGHAYYGKKIGDDDLTPFIRTDEPPFVPSRNMREMHSFLDCFPQEMPTDGLGDFRKSALAVSSSNGNNGIRLKYVSHSINAGAWKLDGLPSVFADSNDCDTLKILTEDEILGVEVTLVYTVFTKINAIARSVEIRNSGSSSVRLNKAMSASFDMDNENFDMLTLHGSWARERHISRHTIDHGLHEVLSMRGETSHQEHPFVAVLDHNADENSGRVWGMNFIYSGNFSACVQLNQFNSIRIMMGINPENFSWKLDPGESFTTPQAVLVFSDSGLNGMSRAFHDLYRNHLIRSPYKDKMRPVLINNWEATYFNFDSDKLVDIAREAAKDGIEMLVMDDGWFGKRNSDNCSLGDWTVNEQKLKGGLKGLVERVNGLGLKFGIWFEPEMISPDSDLFRAHPDWAIQIPGRTPGMSREQYVLDITRQEVADYAYGCVARILRSANIEYVKWDMNRQLSDIGSAALPSDRTGEFYHRYVLALYGMQERLVTDFPSLLLENCSGGGARFDPGMLYYSPQIWCSDDTDAIERLAIQEGTALIYPLSSMGAHVSTCPNHACGRVTPFRTRGYTALSGTFGYELDITRIPAEERTQIPGQIALYKRFGGLIRNGDYYRIASFSGNMEFDCWESVAKDRSEALVTFIQVLNHPNCKSRFIRIPGLDPEMNYRVSYPDENQEEFSPEILSGLTIMNAGIRIKPMWGDFQGRLIHLKAENRI